MSLPYIMAEFPVEIISKFCETRRDLLAMRCTCKLYTVVTGCNWNILVDRAVNAPRYNNRTLSADLSKTHLRSVNKRRVTCFIVACYRDSLSNVPSTLVSSRSCQPSEQLQFAKKLAREYRLLGKNPLIPFRRIRSYMPVEYMESKYKRVADMYWAQEVDCPYTYKQDPAHSVGSGTYTFVDVFARADTFVHDS